MGPFRDSQLKIVLSAVDVVMRFGGVYALGWCGTIATQIKHWDLP